MRRLVLTLEYDGTGFHGWQVQAGPRTVQGAVEEAVRRITGRRTRVSGAGRTDAGVHAEAQVAHFDTSSGLSPERVVPALNYWLPDDVSVLACREAPRNFDARRSARSKLYRYRILRSGPPRPLRERFVLRQWHNLDVAAMARCAALLEGQHDFTSFASEHSECADKKRTVLRSQVLESGDEVHYFVRADGFLYNMVRIIVGTLLQAGRGKITVDDFARALAMRHRSAAGPTAPARGLALVDVDYPPAAPAS
jgi:tRNA pseudouridine38-40 synthase